jgi:CheY-like chemotaxis protein
MTARTLKSLGHSSIEADDGATAIEAVRHNLTSPLERPFDIILMDNCDTSIFLC